jgi:protein TonB
MFSTLVASKPPREGKSGALAGLLSLLFHVVLVGGLFWATLNAGEAAEQLDEEFTIFDIPEEAPPPPPPPPPPPMEEAPPPVEVVAQGFQTLSPPTVILPDIPPPSAAVDVRDFSGVGVEGGRADGDPNSTVTVDDISAAPRFTPMTVRPTIRNMDEVRRALQRYYPPLLRDAGVGGTVVLWFFIDESGEVVRTQVNQSSGHAQLDEAATRVAELIEFTPAQNRDRNVPVWIQWPITFQSTN